MAATAAQSTTTKHTHTLNRAAVLVFGVIVFGEPVLFFKCSNGAHFGSYNYFRHVIVPTFGRLVCYILKLIVCLSEIIVKINKKMRANKRATRKCVQTYTTQSTEYIHRSFTNIYTHTHARSHKISCRTVEAIENWLVCIDGI